MYEETGSGSNYLCLPEYPQYGNYRYPHGSHPQRAYIYSAGYQISYFPPFEGNHKKEVPCAACHSNYGRTLIMIPAVNTCPTTWTREYSGYLMAAYHSEQSTEYVCVDGNSETRTGVSSNTDGAYFFPAEADCTPKGNLECSIYIPGTVLTCAVCTK